MKLKYIISEASRAALYHFTSIENFITIVSSNTLKGTKQHGLRKMMGTKGPESKADEPFISFTRDPRRTMLPSGKMVETGGIGFRFNVDKLKTKYSTTPVSNTNAKQIKKLKDQMKTDPEFAKKVKKDQALGWSRDGVNLTDLAKGTASLHGKWEAEERIYADKIDVKSYVNGVVLPSKKKTKKNKIYPAITLLKMTQSLPLGRAQRGSFDTRKKLLDVIKKLNVNVIHAGNEYKADEVGHGVATIYWLRKNKPEELKKYGLTER